MCTAICTPKTSNQKNPTKNQVAWGIIKTALTRYELKITQQDNVWTACVNHKLNRCKGHVRKYNPIMRMSDEIT